MLLVLSQGSEGPCQAWKDQSDFSQQPMGPTARASCQPLEVPSSTRSRTLSHELSCSKDTYEREEQIQAVKLVQRDSCTGAALSQQCTSHAPESLRQPNFQSDTFRYMWKMPENAKDTI